MDRQVETAVASSGMNQDKPMQSADSPSSTAVTVETPHLVLDQPLTEFKPFPKLPAELRIKIWKFALGGPRIIQVKFERNILNYFARRGKITYRFKCSSKNENPGTLLACKESRVESLKRLPDGISLYKDGQVTRFNSNIDAIFLDEASLVALHCLRFHNSFRYLHGAALVQNLAIQETQKYPFSVEGACNDTFCNTKMILTGTKKDGRGGDVAYEVFITLSKEFDKQIKSKCKNPLKTGAKVILNEKANLQRTILTSSLIVSWNHYGWMLMPEPEVIQYEVSKWEDLKD